MFLITLALSLSCLQDRPEVVIPAPTRVIPISGRITFTEGSRVVSEPELADLADSVAADLSKVTGLDIVASEEESEFADLVLELDEDGTDGLYVIRAVADVVVVGDSITALANGVSTFMQLLNGRELDRVGIHDKPETEFRALMVDVARNYHSIETLKQLIEVCRFSKVRYMQLHLTDDQNWMFPSKVLGDLSAHNSHKKPSYTKDELNELDEYARMRGVELIPEIDVPGHSSILVRAKPDLFKIENANLGNCIDFASEESRKTVKALLKEVAEMFPRSRYMHFGGDEAYYAGAEKDPDFASGLKRLGYDAEGRYLGELFRDFLKDTANYIISLGRTPIAWEGFKSARNSKVKLPEELIIVNWDGAYHPQKMIDDGFTIINANWDPCYVVDHYPRDNFTYAAPARMYQFDPLRFQTFFRGFPVSDGVTVEPTDNIIGGMVCWWEGREENAVRLLVERMAAFGARLWAPDKENDWESFSQRYQRWSQTLEKVIGPIKTLPREGRFERSLTTGASVKTDADLYPSHLPSLVTDGRVGERLDYWMAYPVPADLSIDLGGVKSVDRINVVTFWDGRAFSRYLLETSINGEEWELVADMTDNSEPAVSEGYSHTFASRSVRYIRFIAHGSSKVPGTIARVVEIQAFGPKGS